MNLETFFAKFDQFADAPDAVVKMRELVLHLAVTGKLVPQDPNEEPAETDFKSLVRSRENSALKRTKIDCEATAEDPLIPDSWLGVCLSGMDWALISSIPQLARRRMSTCPASMVHSKQFTA